MFTWDQDNQRILIVRGKDDQIGDFLTPGGIAVRDWHLDFMGL